MNKKRIATIYDYARMCKSMKGCDDCPLSYCNNDEGVVCNKFITNNTDTTNEIVLKWCKEHPAKTYLEDYLEKLPNCKRKASIEVPFDCVNNAYGLSIECSYNCYDCWNRPMEGSDE